MTPRLRPGDRVRHVVDPIEGVVAEIVAGPRPSAPSIVEVQVDSGGVERLAEGFWERLPGGGRLSA